ncbi:DUF21 domain-containing protein At1g47330-like isoform X2 [Durio zibethinus]|uniref:DUF21 domain-containing protein At1g47330-like isoform X2 n=1 Tax=Durio zibethinus TaxID=66656 RepID=A0A6P6B6E2_DURZI|nr:DUF21 domain-containing protein At1g47330-like isoform X2 [Durio zibethinus]
MASDVPCCGAEFLVYLLIIVGLVCFAGLMAGLTLGLMSLGLVDLEVLIKSGRPQDRIHAAKIFPVVKNQHLLLCTLLIGNSLAMEALPIFLDKLVLPWAAILISVTLILMFGEILPQAVCTRYGLKVGAAMAPFVRVLLLLFFPISYPISKVLDWMLGKGHAVLLRRAELKTFVDFHGNEVKNLLTIDSDGPVPLRKMIIRTIPRVSEDIPLYDILNEFQKGHSHIAVVYKDLNESKESVKKCKEGERPEFKDSCKNRRDEPETSRKDDRESGLSTQESGLKLNSQDVQTPVTNSDGGQQTKKSPPATPAFKKRHRGCSYCILDIENAPIPEFPSDEEVVGVITMEDVIEELLQEEILDETDEYVNIHNRIKINMTASQENAPSLNSMLPSPKGSGIQTPASPMLAGHLPQHSPASPNLAAPGPTPALSGSSSTSNTASPAATHQASGEASLKDR